MGLLHRLLLFSLLPREPQALQALQAQEQVLGVAPVGPYPWASCSRAPWAGLRGSHRCSTSCPHCRSSSPWPRPPHQPLGPRQQRPVALHPPPASDSPSLRAPRPTARSWLPLHPLLASLSCSPCPQPHPLKVRPELGIVGIWVPSLLGRLVTFSSVASSSPVSFSCPGHTFRWLSPAAAWEGASPLGCP